MPVRCYKVWPTLGEAGMQLCYQVINLGDQRYRFTGLGVDSSFDVVVSRGNPRLSEAGWRARATTALKRGSRPLRRDTA